MKRGQFIKTLGGLALIPLASIASVTISNKSELEELFDIIKKAGGRYNYWYDCSYTEDIEYGHKGEKGFWTYLSIIDNHICWEDIKTMHIDEWYNTGKHSVFIRIYSQVKAHQLYIK